LQLCCRVHKRPAPKKKKNSKATVASISEKQKGIPYIKMERAVNLHK